MIDGLKIEDDSWAAVTLGTKTLKVDLYRAYNHFVIYEREAREKFPPVLRTIKAPSPTGAEPVEKTIDLATVDRDNCYYDKVTAYLHALGFENVGHRAASKFDDAMTAEVSEMGNADADARTPVSA